MSALTEMASETLRHIEDDIRDYRTAFHSIPEGKRRLGIPVGKWEHIRRFLICQICRLETVRLHCDWFARGVQPAYMDWERDIEGRLQA